MILATVFVPDDLQTSNCSQRSHYNRDRTRSFPSNFDVALNYNVDPKSLRIQSEKYGIFYFDKVSRLTYIIHDRFAYAISLDRRVPDSSP